MPISSRWLSRASSFAQYGLRFSSQRVEIMVDSFEQFAAAWGELERDLKSTPQEVVTRMLGRGAHEPIGVAVTVGVSVAVGVMVGVAVTSWTTYASAGLPL